MLALLFWALLSLSLLEFWLLTRAEETPIPVPALRPTRAQPYGKNKLSVYLVWVGTEHLFFFFGGIEV
jgi:hypothetical protein